MIEEGLRTLENGTKLNIPTLLMHGSKDRICSPQASIQFAETAGDLLTLKIWDGLYHELHNEPEKEQVLDYVIQWMSDRI